MVLNQKREKLRYVPNVNINGKLSKGDIFAVLVVKDILEDTTTNE